MVIRIGKTLPPAAAPITLENVLSGIIGMIRGEVEAERRVRELQEYFKLKGCFLVSSGKAALTVILEALKKMFPDRCEVLIPAFTCYSVPSAIVRAGLKVRLCDVDPETLDFNYSQLANILSRDCGKLLCIVPVHLFGLPADMARTRILTEGKDVVIVEDAAQAMGAEYNGVKLGSSGDVGFFSMGRGKPVSTVEGGIIVTRREDIASYIAGEVNGLPDYGAIEILRLLFYALCLVIFLRPSLFWLPRQLPFLRLGETIFDPEFKIRRMSGFQAGLAKGWRCKLQKMKSLRGENATGLLGKLEKLDVGTFGLKGGSLPDLIRLPLKLGTEQKRELVLKLSERMGLGIAGSYPDSVAGIPELHGDGLGGPFPAAEEIARKIITLPVHPYLTESDKDRIGYLLKRAQ